MHPPAADNLSDPPPQPAAEEVDVWWGSYASRTMLPSFVACLLVTAGLVAGTILISQRFDLPPGSARAGFYGLAGALWVFQGLRWLYRAFGFNYRLTTRRLFCYWGFFHAQAPPVLLAQVSDVLVEQSLVERLLGIGRVRVETESPGPPTVLLGVWAPQQIADEIGRCVLRARGEKV